MSRARSEKIRDGALLVVGPGARGRGGIASVIHLHSLTNAWSIYRGRHLPTFDDRSGAHKVWSALQAYLLAPSMILRSRIVHVHAPSEETLFRQTARWKVRFVFRTASRVVALSGSWAAMIRNHVPEASVAVIPNPVLARPPRVLTSGTEPLILFVGKLDARKG